MVNYKRAYFRLFNIVTDIIEELKNGQSEVEEECINDEKDEKTPE